MATTTTVHALPRESRLAELFLAALGIAFAGYMIFGKSFAYLGLPPLYAGELLFLLGLLAVFRVRTGLNLAAGLATAPALCVAALMGWVLLGERLQPLAVLGFGLSALAVCLAGGKR